MLQVSNYTINEIASSVGFDDPYYFSRFFKQETGRSYTTKELKSLPSISEAEIEMDLKN